MSLPKTLSDKAFAADLARALAMQANQQLAQQLPAYPILWFAVSAPPPEPEPEPELLSEVVLGFRGWRVPVGGAELQSLIGPTLWPIRTPLVAFCQRGLQHAVPDWRCSCGLYSHRLDIGWPTRALDGTVRGLVGLWGRVIRHHDGWRGQYGYPVAFFEPPTPPGFPAEGLLAQLAARYGVPLIPASPESWPAWLRRGAAA